MSMAAGEKIGPYEIIAQLGAGSMGVVYRARDTRLGRDVAVKVMGASIAQDLDRARRFEVEARAAGVLNHPNILAIHDVGTHVSGPYLVSELLEGQSLRDLIHAGKPLSPRRALDYGVQIAQGLAAAHEKGIVHRDLKPENLFVTNDGRVKILDFGLAKLVDPVGAPKHSQSTIRALQIGGGTQPGTVLGTVGYMAPEQVRGQPADHRSDVFAVGAILYELLAGHKAFDGQSGVDVLSAILSDQPPSLPDTVPLGLTQVVQRCLQKSPDDRFQSARDLAFQLETLSPAVASTMALQALQIEKRTVRSRVALVAGAAVLLSAGAYFLARRMAVAPEAVYHQLTFRRGTISSARFGADGQSVVYAASWQGSPEQIFTTQPKSPESRALELPGGQLLALSAKGEMAILLRKHPADGEPAGTLARAQVSGGMPRESSEDVESADWAPDGSLLVVRRAQGRSRLEFPEGKVLYETDGSIGDARLSRDGKRIAFIDHPRRGDEEGAVAVIEPGGQKQLLTASWVNARGLAWSPNGKEVWFTAAEPGAASALRAVTLSGSQRVVARVTGRLALHDVSPSGQVLLARENARAGLSVRAPGDAEERDLAWFDGSLLSDFSADGSVVLFVEAGGEAASHAIYLRKSDGSPAVRLGEGLLSRLSPDGKSVLAIPPQGAAQLSLLPTGAGDSQTLALGDLTPLAAAWFPDGKRLLITGRKPGHAPQLFVRAVDSAEMRPLGEEGVPVAQTAVSPDGKSVAAVDGKQQLMVFSLDGAAPRPACALEKSAPVRFSADGKSLYAFRPGELPAHLVRCDLESGKAEPFLDLRPADSAGVSGIFAALLTSDARGYAFGFRRVLSDLYVVDGLR